MIKLACMTWPYTNCSFERALQGIAAAGYRYVAFGLPHEGKQVPESADEAEAAAIVRQLDRYGLTASMLIGTSWIAPGQPIERAARLFAFARNVGAAEIISLGTWGYRRFPNEPLDADEQAAADDAFTAQLQLVAAEAERAGVTVTLKPHTGNTATASILRETLEAIGSPAVQASYDPGNVHYYEGIDPAADLAAIAEQTVSLIAKDHRGSRGHSDFPIPGKGDVDFDAIFRNLHATGFAGQVVVERIDGTDSSLDADEIDRRLAEARRALIQLMTSAGLAAD
ncbi:sugar phosphate isomerase/epimerase [Paenibacillus sp. J5C_2022]|uniref:sugar phosphate isomerase/epimerase family protein n=1 Tax=Paenibacillus sp. J5C2022 TaxID=2977129 RepID=UPI0021D397C4|nr:sugar phosphate isomerase/epimerase [Paenibacillus sp. J5C2022]MCU6712132.1 sugar phosphate isomerase/epimerase [Paenibacillus sp. J5C2022]